MDPMDPYRVSTFYWSADRQAFELALRNGCGVVEVDLTGDQYDSECERDSHDASMADLHESAIHDRPLVGRTTGNEIARDGYSPANSWSGGNGLS